MIIEKPWGHEIIWAKTEFYIGKILFIKHGHQLSLQYHNVKDETILVQYGVLTLELDGDTFLLQPGQSQHIQSKSIHRMRADSEDVSVIEVSTIQLNDVVRIQDDYGRTNGDSLL